MNSRGRAWWALIETVLILTAIFLGLLFGVQS